MPTPDPLFSRPAAEALSRIGVTEETRLKWEQGMGNVLQTSSKWLNNLRK